jgi:GAF domain-containing protein
VENARLYDATRRHQRWVQASAEVTTALLSGTEPDEVLTSITRQTPELFGSDLTVLALPDAEGSRLTIACAEGDGAEAVRGLVLPVGQPLSGQVLAPAATPSRAPTSPPMTAPLRRPGPR